MEPLYKVFHKYDNGFYEETYKQRLSIPTIQKTGLYVKPMNDFKTYELYYIPSFEMLKLTEEIFELDQKFHDEFNILPQVAQKQYILECIADELQNTNEIEGVRSSREEIVRSARALSTDSHEKKRFTSMIASYVKLSSDELTIIDKPKDIRKIYDYLLEDEIEKEDLPDGEIFRKDLCVVYKKSGTMKEIHKGVFPEEKIIEKLLELINFLNSDSQPLLIRIAIAHYYFGYIHPFYDGNGRISRFISSMYLKRKFSPITSISLSRGCNKFVENYLKAFENTNKSSNRGELNEFIQSFLEIIRDTQSEMLGEIKEKRYLLDQFVENMENNEIISTLGDIEKNIIFVLGQNLLFSSEKGLTSKELSGIFEGKSIQSIRRTLNDLVDRKIVDVDGERPKTYYISDNLFK